MPVVLIAIAIIMVEGFDLQAIGFVAPEIARSWSLDIASFGLVFSAGLAGSMVGAVLAGPLARRIGLKRVIAGSLLIFGGFTLVTAWVRDLHTLALLRFIVGLGLGASIPAVMSIVAVNSSPRFRATLVVVALCGQPIGAIAGAALCARLIPTHGWQFAFYLGGLLPLALLGTLPLLPSDRAPVSADERSIVPGRLRDLFLGNLTAMTTLLWIGAFLTTAFLYVVVNWLPSAVRASGYSLEESVLAISVFNVGGICGAVLLGFLMDRFGPLRVMPVAFALAALAAGALDQARAVPAALLTASFLTGLAGYGGGLSYASLTLMLYPRPLATTGVGCAIGIGRLGAAVGPLGAGLLLGAHVGIGQLFYFAAAAAALVMLCLILLSRVPMQRIHELSRSA